MLGLFLARHPGITPGGLGGPSGVQGCPVLALPKVQEAPAPAVLSVPRLVFAGVLTLGAAQGTRVGPQISYMEGLATTV